MIWGYRLQPSVPSLRSGKRSGKRKDGAMWSPARSARDRGDTACSQLCQPCPPVHTVLEPRGSGRRLPRQSGAGPAEASRPPERPSGCATQAGGRGPGGGSPPLPPGGAGASNGGAAAPSARARRSLPAQPAALGPAPRPRGGPRRAGWAPSAALHWRAPSAGVRPSRGYITGLGPSGAAGGLGVQAVGGRDAAAHLPYMPSVIRFRFRGRRSLLQSAFRRFILPLGGRVLPPPPPSLTSAAAGPPLVGPGLYPWGRSRRHGASTRGRG